LSKIAPTIIQSCSTASTFSKLIKTLKLKKFQ
jgi:hypothetical protein